MRLIKIQNVIKLIKIENIITISIFVILTKVPGINARQRADYPMANSDMISGGSSNDISGKANFGELGGEFKESHNDYRIEMQPITDNEINQMEELAIAHACGGGVDLQDTIHRIGNILQFVSL